jgi:hypothetical protein
LEQQENFNFVLFLLQHKFVHELSRGFFFPQRQNMDIWIVETKKLYLGCRIEGFNITFEVYTNKDKALQSAFAKACEFQKQHVDFSDEGYYVYHGSSSYDWPTFQISTSHHQFDPNVQPAFKFQTGDETI